MPFLTLAGKGLRAQIPSMAVHRLTFCCCYFHFRCAVAVPGEYPGGKLCHREANEVPWSRGKWGSPELQLAQSNPRPSPWVRGTAEAQHRVQLLIVNFNKVKRYRWRMAPDFPDPTAQSRSPAALIVTCINKSHQASQGWVYSEAMEQQLSKGDSAINFKPTCYLFWYC